MDWGGIGVEIFTEDPESMRKSQKLGTKLPSHQEILFWGLPVATGASGQNQDYTAQIMRFRVDRTYSSPSPFASGKLGLGLCCSGANDSSVFELKSQGH